MSEPTADHAQPGLETLLRDAGFTFTLVDRCPDPQCVVCGRVGKPKAA